jgi:hypothetical protein
VVFHAIFFHFPFFDWNLEIPQFPRTPPFFHFVKVGCVRGYYCGHEYEELRGCIYVIAHLISHHILVYSGKGSQDIGTSYGILDTEKETPVGNHSILLGPPKNLA